MKTPKFTPADAAQIEQGLKGSASTPEQKAINRLMDSAFCHTQREPRSGEYRLGALAVLQARLHGDPMQPNPYPAGTAQADAWWAGVEEGKAIHQFHQAQGVPA